jgi:ParB/RepB/Spo0J family partition protein
MSTQPTPAPDAVAVAVAKRDLKPATEVPIESLVTEHQVRQHFDAESLQEMAASMREVGVIQPIVVRRNDAGQLVVVDGERRLRAAKLAGLKQVPVTTRDGTLDDREIRQQQFIANVHRADLNDDEKAEALDQLIKQRGCTAAQVAKLVGISASAASRLLSLLTATPELRLAVRLGQVASSSVYEVTKARDPARRDAMTTLLLNGAASREELKMARRAAPDRHRIAPSGRKRRWSFPVDDDTEFVVVSRTVSDTLVLGGIVDLLRGWIRKAVKQGLTPDTLAKAMRDQLRSRAAALPRVLTESRDAAVAT